MRRPAFGCGRYGIPLVIEQDAVGGALQVVELAGADRPQKCHHDDGNQDQRQRDQQVENLHASGPEPRLRGHG